jgi:hypothetical protein
MVSYLKAIPIPASTVAEPEPEYEPVPLYISVKFELLPRPAVTLRAALAYWLVDRIMTKAPLSNTA